MNRLREALDDYLAVPARSWLQAQERELPAPRNSSIILSTESATTVTTELALAWAREPVDNPNPME